VLRKLTGGNLPDCMRITVVVMNAKREVPHHGQTHLARQNSPDGQRASGGRDRPAVGGVDREDHPGGGRPHAISNHKDTTVP